MDESRGPVWVTQNGREIPIPKLEHSHLINIINYLRRRMATSFIRQNRVRAMDEFVGTGDHETLSDLLPLPAPEFTHKNLIDFFEETSKAAPGRESVRAWAVKGYDDFSVLIEDPDGLGVWHAVAHNRHPGYRDLWDEAVKRGDIILDELIEDGGEDPRVE